MPLPCCRLCCNGRAACRRATRPTTRQLRLAGSMSHPPIAICCSSPGACALFMVRKKNRHRPAVDPLFRSAAWAYHSRVVGVVLSGNLDDGTAGLSAIKACGGMAVVQDPAEALFSDMPFNALRNVAVDHQLTIKQIARLLNDLANRTTPDASDHVSSPIQTEVEFIKMTKEAEDMSQLGGNPTAFACPSCHGALWELQNGNLTRYRCHTGHAFSPESLLAEQSDAIEQALYSAFRALREKATALRRLAARFDNMPELQRDYELRANDAEKSADSIRDLLNGGKESSAHD